MGSLDEKISVVKAKPWLVSLVCAVFIATRIWHGSFVT